MISGMGTTGTSLSLDSLLQEVGLGFYLILLLLLLLLLLSLLFFIIIIIIVINFYFI